MEPITILAAVNTVAKTARSTWDIGEALYFFINDAKVVDQTVKDLHSEIKKLGDACDLAHSQLQGLSQQYTAKNGLDDDRLWRCFVDQAEECDRTIAQLSRSVGSADEVRRNPFKRAWRQLQLNMSAAEIESARSRIRSHTSSLHTILLTINIKVSNLAPRIANQELVTKISTLTDMVARLQDSQGLGLTTTMSGQQLHITHDNLIQCAQEVVTDSTTLYEESVAGGSIAETIVPSAAEADHLTVWLRDLELRNANEASTSLHSPVPPDLSTQPAPALPQIPIPTALQASNSPVTKEQDEGVDSEDEMAADIARASCQLGTNAMKAGKYQEADEFLKEGMSLLQAVPSHHRGKVVYLWGLQYQMAVCTFHVGQPQQAVESLVKITQREAKDDTERVSVCTASHLLSQAYVKLGKLELARQSCEQALNGRRKLLGKKHKLYQESIALMAKIFELQGNSVRAKVYLGMIDYAVHPDVAMLFEDLRTLGADSESHSSTMPHGILEGNNFLETTKRKDIRQNVQLPVVEQGPLSTFNPVLVSNQTSTSSPPTPAQSKVKSITRKPTPEQSKVKSVVRKPVELLTSDFKQRPISPLERLPRNHADEQQNGFQSGNSAKEPSKSAAPIIKIDSDRARSPERSPIVDASVVPRQSLEHADVPSPLNSRELSSPVTENPRPDYEGNDYADYRQYFPSHYHTTRLGDMLHGEEERGRSMGQAAPSSRERSLSQDVLARLGNIVGARNSG